MKLNAKKRIYGESGRKKVQKRKERVIRWGGGVWSPSPIHW